MAAHLPLYPDQIERLIPHSGSMCLINRVDYWDEQAIHCAATSHKDADNPLRLDGKLSSIHLLEYGAQAMAIHGALLTNTATAGVLAAVRNVELYIDKLDNVHDEIIIIANEEINTATGAIYQFVITDPDANALLKAKATVIKNWEQAL